MEWPRVNTWKHHGRNPTKKNRSYFSAILCHTMANMANICPFWIPEVINLHATKRNPCLHSSFEDHNNHMHPKNQCHENIWVFPKNRGIPKWMVYNAKNPIFGNTHMKIPPKKTQKTKRPNQTLEVWDSSVGSRRVVVSACQYRVRPCCPKGPTNKCAPKQERSSKTWSFSSNTTRCVMCVLYMKYL